MCKFCDKIYPDEDVDDIVFGRGKYSNIRFGDKPFITIDEEGCYDINVNPGDPFQMGTIFSIKYCPYCGRDLAESKEHTENKNCNTCKHYKTDNPYCECCFDFDKYERRIYNV